jgi:hypothetical protein
MAGKLRFQIQMKGAGLLPEAVRARDLATFLTNLETAIVETAKAQQIPLAYDPEEVLVSLVRIEAGESTHLTIAIQEPISFAANQVSRAIAQRRFDTLPFEAQESLHRISVQAVQNHCAYEFHPTEELQIIPSVISYEFQVLKPSEVTIVAGDSTLWGNLFKIGGRIPTAIIRQRNGKLFPATITMELVYELQHLNLLYKDIGLVGKARWRVPGWSLASFAATSLADYRPDEINLIETFRQLRDVSGRRWESVDPIKYVDDLRSGEA